VEENRFRCFEEEGYNPMKGIKGAKSAAFPLAAAALLTLSAPAAYAQGRSISVTVDGEVVNFAGQQPIEQLGSVLVPLRGVFERLGAQVAYDGATKTILAVKGQTSVSLTLGSNTAVVNGNMRTLTRPAQAINGTTLVPLRFVSEALGADVGWRGASRTVVISTTGGNGSIATGGETVASGGAGTAAPAAVEVASLTHDANRALRAGETLTVTLQGTPGATGSFSIPGIEKARDIPMKEVGNGTYVGSFTIPNGVNVKGASILASLKRAGRTSPLVQAGSSLTVDAVGPTLASLSPAPNTTLAPGRPMIYGTLSDAGTGVSAGNTRLLINGRDVTGQATVTEAFFSYRPEEDLPLGKNTVAVVARDEAGNETRREWAFTLSQAEALIKDIQFSPETKTLEPGDVMTVRLTAQPNGRARFSIGGAVTNRAMTEGQNGVYTGSYTVKKGDSLAQAPITVTFTSANGRTVTQTANQAVTIAAGAPERPTITTPQAGAAVGDTVTFKGKAAPNATVRYHITYQGVLLILPAGGTIADGEVKADAQGNWTIPDVRISAPPGVSKLTYALEVQAVGASGEASEKATIQFKR
jgi:hypothetical protein